MYLSKLELHGFKSFADRTVLQFDPGITSVVGPNGCGKSNIIDAVRWVLGAQRPTLLRSDTMANVIFNGAANRRALGLAEVQLTVENTRNVLPTEYTEVTVGRRLYRSGDSEYLLNGIQCRLKDIEELFMDTGMGPDAYSVIELKMVDEILSNKGDSRRTLFEEAAGITKYKQRRKQALRKLDQTQSDLTRVRDITSELETQVKRLKKQADKASKHKTFRRKLRRLELQLAAWEFSQMRQQTGQLTGESQELTERIEELTSQQNKEEARLEEQRTALTEREQELAKQQKVLNGQIDQIRQLESDVRLEKERRETAQRGLKRLKQKKEEAAQRHQALEKTRNQLQETIDNTRPTLKTAQKALKQADAVQQESKQNVDARRQALQTKRKKEEKAGAQRAKLQSKVDRLKNRIELLEEEHGRIGKQLQTSKDTAAKLKSRIQEANTRVEQAQARFEVKEEALAEAKQQTTAKKKALKTAEKKRQQLERGYDALAAEVRLLESLVSSYDEYGDTVKFLAETNWSNRAFQTVADILACDEDDRLALNAALGPYRSCILVETPQEARQAIRKLRDEEKGQATFLVLNQLKDLPTRPSKVDTPEKMQAALEQVRVLEPAYQPVAQALLANCFFADTLEAAQAAAANHPSADTAVRFVARSGEWVDAAGTIHGGGEPGDEAATAHRLGRREQLEETRQQLAAKKEAVDQQTAVVNKLEEELANIPLEQHRRARQAAQNNRSEAQQNLQQLSYEQKSLAERHEEQQKRLAKTKSDLKKYRALLDEKQQAVKAASQALTTAQNKRKKAKQAFETAEASYREAAQAYNEARLETVEIKNELENLQREQKHADEGLQTLTKQAKKQAAETQELQQTAADAEKQTDKLKQKIKTAYKQRDKLQKAVHKAEEAVAQLRASNAEREKLLQKIRRSREKKINENNERSKRLAQLETRLENLVQRILDEYEIDLTEAEIDRAEDFDEQQARSRIPALRKKLRKLGAVNELALETYEEEKDRLEFMQSQQTDLEASEDTLLQTISEINKKATARFNETFSKIQEHFSRLFTELFGQGAKAEVYVEGDHPLDAPIRIKAKPRGKKPGTLAQLSSGEKTLTAIALLFAIYLVKPSPFCILDEVDAPLDDANVNRFMRLIRRFSEDTQFILVTHNKQTMEAADRLYGVTMQERGVSTLVGVKFDEALDLVA